ncbi:hypothetical protein GCM10010449_23180 [Streptomyces rectiviolaceus]|uniref:Uncharacterized protein n=1 Tax=Streptomyces rectiviolaceus TaxID=332591 RepID=A0ABP6ME29_9ACTN
MLGPSALALAGDLTTLVGDSVRKANDDTLKRCVARLQPAIEADSARPNDDLLPRRTPPSSPAEKLSRARSAGTLHPAERSHRDSSPGMP